ncbi:hypothetical protein HG536_0A09030 [Torulaspora globosa]|uniref:G10 protein n=1 Tax=Torulaspora globosa TaxID=48254 RepID=A0A7G3ZC50_9SACH|nr:uncharacterized protein HG536_0A09030 [Torulaspora globosa]QLL31086.1 hypothetical protein HG536_0A09030 [Torulaspora globosa]
MVRIRTKRSRPAPEGFGRIEPTLREFDLQLRAAEHSRSSKMRSKANEPLWEIMRIHHERSRYVYSLFYRRKAISRELYQWLLQEKYADQLLIAKWKKQGYEKLCCLRCIQTTESADGTTCICRVPRAQLENDARETGRAVTFKQCVHCGCRGCASSD